MSLEKYSYCTETSGFMDDSRFFQSNAETPTVNATIDEAFIFRCLPGYVAPGNLTSICMAGTKSAGKWSVINGKCNGEFALHSLPTSQFNFLILLKLNIEFLHMIFQPSVRDRNLHEFSLTHLPKVC